MTQYLYVPFKKKELAQHQKALLDYWITLETAKNNKLEVCYYGEKSLKKISENATISVLLPGTPGHFPLVHGAKEISSEILRHHASFSGHLRLTDGTKKVRVKPTLANNMNKEETVPNELLVPGIANQMIEDGLLENFSTSIHFKLFFFEAGYKSGTLAKSFHTALMTDPRNQNGAIRVHYYHNDPRRVLAKLMPDDPKKNKSATTQAHVFLNETTANSSFYNKEKSYPKLTTDQITAVLALYNSYKSSRFHGLSGLLGLNGLFSSNVSLQTIQFLKSTNPVHSEQECYDYALLFTKKFPENQLAKFLNTVLEQSLKSNDSDWTIVKSEDKSTLQLK